MPKKIKLLLLAYVGLLPFVNVVTLPVFAAKLQPTELIFLALLPAFLFYFGWRALLRPRALVGLGAAYVAANYVSAIHSGALTPVLEATGRLYLLLVFFIIVISIVTEGREWAMKLLRVYFYAMVAHAAAAYIGYALGALGYSAGMVHVYGNYPYLGTVLRATGITTGSTMLISVLTPAILFAWREARLGRLSFGWFCFLLPLAFLTFSKEVLLTISGLLLVDPWLGQMINKYGKIATTGRLLWIVGTALVFWLGTHYIIQPPSTEQQLAGTFYTSEKVVWRGDHFQLLETSYTALKKSGMQIARDYWVLGVGPGDFASKGQEAKAKGYYPEHLPDYDPHSTWIGAWSETGIGGFVTLLLLTIAIGTYVHQIQGVEEGAMVPSVYLLLMMISSVSADIANFRFVWFFAAVVVGLAVWKKTKTIDPGKPDCLNSASS